MYRGFNLRNIGFNGKELSIANTYDRSHPNVFKSNIIDSIDSFIETEYTFDGNALINKWFPKLNRPDIFISHSHDDENLAKALAMWLEDTFSLTSFIDSTVWGDFTLLRKKINNYFITKLGSTYDCDQQDRVSQHVMMMLNASLMEMMDRCQCLFFLNTPNSISVKTVRNNSTYSPWIFSEIGMFNCIQKKTPAIKSIESGHYKEFANIAYQLDLTQLTELTATDLINWQKECSNIKSKTALSYLNKLYDLHPLKKRI